MNTNLCIFFSDFVWNWQIALWEEISFFYVSGQGLRALEILRSALCITQCLDYEERRCAEFVRELLDLRDELLHDDT